MKFIKMQNSGCGDWSRDCDLKQLDPLLSNFSLEYERDSDLTKWKLSFEDVAAYRMTSEEFSRTGNLAGLPIEGAFFEIDESEWINNLTGSDNSFKLKHYVFCFYDEVVEVAAKNAIIEELK